MTSARGLEREEMMWKGPWTRPPGIGICPRHAYQARMRAIRPLDGGKATHAFHTSQAAGTYNAPPSAEQALRHWENLYLTLRRTCVTEWYLYWCMGVDGPGARPVAAWGARSAARRAERPQERRGRHNAGAASSCAPHQVWSRRGGHPSGRFKTNQYIYHLVTQQDAESSRPPEAIQ